jgi:hypothetical protein
LQVFLNQCLLYIKLQNDVEIWWIILCVFFCTPNQYLWYIKTFSDELYKHCKTAAFSGNIICMFWYLFLLLDTLYKSGLQFCEANNFNVVTNGCFSFDENV